MSDAPNSRRVPIGAPPDAPGANEDAVKRRLLEAFRRALSPEGQAEALQRIAARGPRYGADADDPTQLVRISPDGTRERGRMIGGEFIPNAAIEPDNAGPTG